MAWVLDELRKSLESASSALRRFVRDAQMARGEDMASVDAGQLRIARQHMHQAVGALEMVGWRPPPTCCAAWKARSRNSSSVPSCAPRPPRPRSNAPASRWPNTSKHCWPARPCRR
ncbi:hypothetical protein HK414_03815 [Ramlibacter terrae]|uniref:HPt domain-containing protein n=1 Tax=Ramlibacter terrae TaxID=2732511 RepID=A0ABX6P0J6_9BURK|nr:hypothetical protein HK414_03815 [Ramlibacter terrae]